MHRTVFATVRATFATLLLGGMFSVVAFAALPSLPASAAPPTCTDQWNVTAAGTYSWNTPGDWSTGSVPGTGDVACINKAGKYTVQLIGGTTTVDALVVGSGTSSDQETLQIEGTCSNNATLDTKNTAFSPDSDAINSTGQILLGSTSCGNNATLGIGTSLAESSGGVLEADVGAGGTRLISGNLTTDGTTNIDEVTQYSAGTWDNAGPFNLATGETFTTETGTPIATFTDDTGGSVVSTGSGQLVVDGGNTYNQGNGTTSGEPVLLTTGASGPSIALHYTGTGASTVETQGTGTLDGTISSGQTLDINGTCSDNATETVDASLTSKGSVHLTSSACGNPSTLAVGSGFTFTNGSGGVLQADAGDGGTRSISGNVTSDGTTNVDETSQYSAGTWDNAGPFNLADGVSMTTESGTPIATFTDDTGGSVTSSGTNQTGQLVVDGGNTYNQGNGTTSGEPVLLTTGESGPSIALHYTGTGASTVETEGTGTLDGNIASGQTLDINGTCSDNATETVDASLTSKGSVHLTSSGCGNPSTLAVGSGFTFTNGSGGVLETDTGDGGTRSISGKITSDGTTNVDEVSQYSAGTWNNAGPFNLATGVTFTTETGTPTATFTDNTGGSVVSTGTGQLTVDGGNTYNQGNGTTSGEPVLLTTGESGPSIALHYTGTGASTVETEGTGTLDGNIASGQTLDVNGTCSDNATETLDASLAVSGTIQLTSSGCGNPSTLAVPKPLLLTVNKSGQVNTIAGDGGSRFLSGNITNSGKINVNEATTYTPIKRGKFTNSGKVLIGTGLSLEVASVKKSVFFNTTKGLIKGTGQLVINDLDTFDQGAGKIKGTPVLIHSASTPATLDISGAGKGAIDVEGSTKFVGNIAAGQTVNVLGTCSLNAVLTGSANASNAGTLNLSNVSCGNNSTFALPAGDTLTNAATGVIETLQGDGGGTRAISANVANNGTIGPSGAETLTIDGNLTDGSTAVFDASVASSSSDLITLGAGDTAALAGSLVAVPVAGFTPMSGYSTTVVSGTYSGTFTPVGPTGWSAAYPTGSVKLDFT